MDKLVSKHIEYMKGIYTAKQKAFDDEADALTLLVKKEVNMNDKKQVGEAARILAPTYPNPIYQELTEQFDLLTVMEQNTDSDYPLSDGTHKRLQEQVKKYHDKKIEFDKENDKLWTYIKSYISSSGADKDMSELNALIAVVPSGIIRFHLFEYKEYLKKELKQKQREKKMRAISK